MTITRKTPLMPFEVARIRLLEMDMAAEHAKLGPLYKAIDNVDPNAPDARQQYASLWNAIRSSEDQWATIGDQLDKERRL